MQSNACCICSQIRGDASNDLLARLVDSDRYVRRVPLESESFAVIPSVGPLVPGHVLLCPRRHFKSFAQMPNGQESEFAITKKRLAEVLAKTFGKPIHCFEHGSAKKAAQPMCTVEHAHLHFVPTEVEVWPTIKADFAWHRIESGIASLSAVVGEMEYILYESPDGRSFVTCGREGTFESQYLRRVFATALGNDGWNWRKSPRVPMMSLTYAALSREFSGQQPGQ